MVILQIKSKLKKNIFFQKKSITDNRFGWKKKVILFLGQIAVASTASCLLPGLKPTLLPHSLALFLFCRLILEVQTYVEQLGEECTVNLVVNG
jgi:hypothetical protein